MPTYNNAINPKAEDFYTVQLTPCRAEKIKTAKTMPSKGSAGGATNVSKGEVYVPSASTAEGRTIRLHEAMHAAHTPKSSKFKDMLDQVLEDARLHRYCSRTARSSFKQARRDELAVALRDLRKTIRRDKLRPINSLAAMRSLAILQADKIKPNHARLAAKACAKLGPDAQRDFERTLHALANCNGDTDSKSWKDTRQIAKKYFAEDFESEIPTPSIKGVRSKDKTGEKTLADSPMPPGLVEDGPDKLEEPKEPKPKESPKPEDSDEDSSAESEEPGDTDAEDEPDSDADNPEEDTDGDGVGTASESDADGEDAVAEPTELGKGTADDKIAPIQTTPRPKKQKHDPDVYSSDLTPACDEDAYKSMAGAYPVKLYVRRLDMDINRVKLSLGRNAPMPCMTGRKILARKLAMTVTPGSKIFAREVSQGGFGTIVIDASSSMNIPESVLMSFLASAPALTLAFYNAPNDNFHCDLTGNIFIYAANGYRASLPDIRYAEHYGPGNVIDYQVMAWLIKQPAPRYIVTDKGFTSIWRDAAHELCSKLEKSKQLTVVPNLEQMQEILSKSTGKKK